MLDTLPRCEDKEIKGMRIGVIGLGNPLRSDDGIGIKLLEGIRGRIDNKSYSIDYVDIGIPGIRLLHYLPLYDIVFLIDAMDFKGKPGEHVFCTYEEIENNREHSTITTHVDDVYNILRVAKSLGLYPRELYIFGVQPKNIDIGLGLSPELEAYLPGLTYRLERTIRRVTQKKRKIT